MAGGDKIECTVPVLGVRDLAESIAFYTEILGFSHDWGGSGGTVCSVSRDGHSIMLSKAAKGDSAGWVWIGLEDDSLFEEYRVRGVKIVQEPANYSHAYEMKIEDVDGNVLWLGTEPREDLPLAAKE